MANKYSGADWVKAAYKGVPMCEFGEKVADFLGDLFLGIYHIQPFLPKVDWNNPHMVEVNVEGGMSTFDDSKLTALVVLAHDRCIRVEINPNMRYLKLRFFPRVREGALYERHPTMEDQMTRLRAHYGAVEVV